jgi:hypothetical protein
MAIRKVRKMLATACMTMTFFNSRFLSSIGPQISFPIPEGILNHHGKNEVLISLWALSMCSFIPNHITALTMVPPDASGAKLGKLELNKRASIASSKPATVSIVPAPGWAELRGNIVTN